VGDFVDWEVFSNSCPRRPPHERAEGWVQLDQEGTVTLWGAIGGIVRYQLMQPGQRWVDFRGRADHPQGSHVLTMLYQEDQWGGGGFNGQDRDWCGGKAVSNPPLDAVPKYV